MSPNDPFNAQIRSAGNRSRSRLPDIGQGAQVSPNETPAIPPPQVFGSQPIQSPTPPTPPPPSPMSGGSGGLPNFGPGAVPPGAGAPPPNQGMMASPMRAPAIQPSTFTVHPPGSEADPNQYNYEPQPDGSWRVYPPGVGAPAHTASASLPRAASTGDYMRMSRAFGAGNPSLPPPRPPTG